MLCFGNIKENESDESMGAKAEVSLDGLSVFSATNCKFNDLIMNCKCVGSSAVTLSHLVCSLVPVYWNISIILSVFHLYFPEITLRVRMSISRADTQ